MGVVSEVALSNRSVLDQKIVARCTLHASQVDHLVLGGARRELFDSDFSTFIWFDLCCLAASTERDDLHSLTSLASHGLIERYAGMRQDT